MKNLMNNVSRSFARNQSAESKKFHIERLEKWFEEHKAELTEEARVDLSDFIVNYKREM